MSEMNDHIRSVKDLYKPKRTDSEIVARCKAEYAAILAGRDTFEYLGQAVKVRTRESAYRTLGLHARWGQ